MVHLIFNASLKSKFRRCLVKNIGSAAAVNSQKWIGGWERCAISAAHANRKRNTVIIFSLQRPHSTRRISFSPSATIYFFFSHSFDVSYFFCQIIAYRRRMSMASKHRLLNGFFAASVFSYGNDASTWAFHCKSKCIPHMTHTEKAQQNVKL